jgi:hypothetical protein
METGEAVLDEDNLEKVHLYFLLLKESITSISLFDHVRMHEALVGAGGESLLFRTWFF